MTYRINPSILSADFANFESELQRIRNADFVHVDVMDNHFVPNLTFGLPMVKRLNEVSPIPLDVHLMIDNADVYAQEYAQLGAYSVTFHQEASEDPVTLARKLRESGSRAGIAVKPGTDISFVCEHVTEFDQVLVMTVEPGFGGQSFMPEVLGKLAVLFEKVKKVNKDIWLQVDGGITEETLVLARDAGADTFVAGSAVFSAPEPALKVETLRAIANRSSHSHDYS